ncbi:hypothetical protein LIS04_04 [Listeria phage LIS04]|nr:hypothetical protein LIS04_04 [Listeria phage LIS04]
MTIYRDQLFHNQIREGLELVVKEDFCCMTDDGVANLDKGMVVTVTNVIELEDEEGIAVRVQGDFELMTMIDSIVEIFDRVVDLHELQFNSYATPLHTSVN